MKGVLGTRSAIGLVALAVLLGACADDGTSTTRTTTTTTALPATTSTTVPPATSTSTTVPPATTTTTVATTTAPPATTTTVVCDRSEFARSERRDDTMPSEVAVLEAVRTGAQQCYERVTFAFRAGHAPQWIVRAAEPPFAGPSGEPVAVAGASFLLVRFETTSARYPGIDGYTGPDSITPIGFRAIRQIRLFEDFEAMVQFAIGLDRARAFRVGTLVDPPRVYVDVALD